MADEQTTEATPVGADLPPERAAVLAELEAMDGPPSFDEPAPEPADEAEGEQETQEATPADEPAPEPTSDEPEPEPEQAADPDLDKRLEAIRREEERSKLAFQERMAGLEKREAELQEREQKVSALESIQERARYDFPGAVEALGIPRSEYEDRARELYDEREGADNPNARRAHRDRAMSREMQDRLDAMEKRNKELEQRIEQQHVQAQTQQRVEAFLEQTTKAANEQTPLVSKLISNDPQEARKALAGVAIDLATEYGEDPEPAQVVKRLEEIKVAELKRLGFDPAAVVGSDSTPKNEPRAEEKRTARTLSSDLGTPTKPPDTAPKTRAELKADVLRQLESGSIE